MLAALLSLPLAAVLDCARRWSVLLFVLLVAVPTVPAVAQQAGPGPRRASFDRSAPAVRFSRQTPQVGDQVEQTIAVELRMATSERRGMEVQSQAHSMVRNAQRRVMTTSDVAGGRSTGIRVRYVSATRQMGRSEGAAEPSGDAAPAEREPVDGKVYDCRRAGDALVVTDERGGIPPLAEYEIVARHMEMLGRPNPLADFLAGQTIRVGQRVPLPAEVADRLLGLGEQMGKVTRFDLTLTGTSTAGGAPCAVFEADVEAVSSDSSQMRMQVSGRLVVETGTCRAVRVELSGPIGMSETRGSYSTKYYLVGTGHVDVKLQSAYHDVRR